MNHPPRGASTAPDKRFPPACTTAPNDYTTQPSPQGLLFVGSFVPVTLERILSEKPVDDHGNASGVAGWVQSSAHRSARLGAGGRTTIAPAPRGGMEGAHGIIGASSPRMAGNRGVGSAGGGSRAGDGLAGGGRINIPQRYARSRERSNGNSASGPMGTAGGSRRAVRHRGYGAGADVAGAAGRLPSIGGAGGGSSVGVAREPSGLGARAAYPKTQLGGSKELVVRTEGCASSGVCTIKVRPPRLAEGSRYISLSLARLSRRGNLVPRWCLEGFDRKEGAKALLRLAKETRNTEPSRIREVPSVPSGRSYRKRDAAVATRLI